MRLKIIVHETDTTGLWAEVPSLPGCVSRGKNYQELMGNLYSTLEKTLSVDHRELDLTSNSKLMEVII
jgi:predicted RNase H-like HicB family nuclease